MSVLGACDISLLSMLAPLIGGWSIVMYTIYVRLSDLQMIENMCPQDMDSQLDVHIISDMAWQTPDGSASVEVVCMLEDVLAVQTIFPSVVVNGRDQQSIDDLRRRFGC